MPNKNQKDQSVTKNEVEEIVDDRLEIWGGQLQDQIKNVEERLEKKIDETAEKVTDGVVKRMDDKIAQYVEIQADQHLGAKADEVDGIKTKVEGHDKRIEELETRAGVR